MTEDKVFQLLERSIAAQEITSKAIERLDKNTQALNDNFVLHCSEQGEITRELKLIKEHLLVWIKWLVTAVIGILAALAGIKQLTDFL